MRDIEKRKLLADAFCVMIVSWGIFHCSYKFHSTGNRDFCLATLCALVSATVLHVLGVDRGIFPSVAPIYLPKAMELRRKRAEAAVAMGRMAVLVQPFSVLVLLVFPTGRWLFLPRCIVGGIAGATETLSYRGWVAMTWWMIFAVVAHINRFTPWGDDDLVPLATLGLFFGCRIFSTVLQLRLPLSHFAGQTLGVAAAMWVATWRKYRANLITSYGLRVTIVTSMALGSIAFARWRESSDASRHGRTGRGGDAEPEVSFSIRCPASRFYMAMGILVHFVMGLVALQRLDPL
jgi:hypothetical protein